MDNRTSTINLGGQDYELLLSTRATKAIATRYGGLEQLGDRLMKTENFEEALDEFCWLIALLANQPICIHNLWHPEDKKQPLTEEMVELLTTPLDLAEYKEAIVLAMNRGTARHVISEDSGTKNKQAS